MQYYESDFASYCIFPLLARLADHPPRGKCGVSGETLTSCGENSIDQVVDRGSADAERETDFHSLIRPLPTKLHCFAIELIAYSNSSPTTFRFSSG